ncbi:MAG: hypothetical protein LQ346_005560 [Caloplaca aetnensis]|nr:MAG: hypothetical protein LQ346_005560 [Caloplaca aetnensis]
MDYESSSTTTTPVVQGFTAVNQSCQSINPSEIIDATTSTGSGKQHGKKRPRKASKPSSATSKTIKGPQQRQPKKAKRLAIPDDQDVSKTFAITKPHADDHLLRHGKSKDLAPGSSGEAGSRKSILSVDDLSRATQIETSPATALESPFSRGLGSIYQAAFQRVDQKGRADTCTEIQSIAKLCSDVASPHAPNALEPGSVSTVIGSLEHDQSAPLSMAHGALDSLLQVPCSSGILSDVEHIKAELAESADMTTSLDCSFDKPEESFNWQGNWRACTFQTESATFPTLGMAGPDTSMNHSGPHGDEDDTMDVDDAEFSLFMSKYTNVDEESPRVSPANLPDSFDFSLSSDFEQTVSSFDDDTEIFSNPIFVESSSPYLRSLSDPQPSTGKVKVSEKTFLDLEEQFFEEETYNDDDLEAALQCFDSPPSAQAPPKSPSDSPIQEPTAPPRRALSTPGATSTSPLNAADPTKREMAPPALPTLNRASVPKNVPHKVSFDQAENPIPFIRPPFPVPVRDRSPVVGLSSQTVLRACFHIGEALNAGSTALRTKQDAVIELYARVAHSERPAGSVKQHFQFADIFSPDKPPFLKGTYGLWKGVELWDKDSKVFLGEEGKGKMARVVGRMVRDEKTRGLELNLLSVWEADWEDVGICKGHYYG